MTLFFFFPTFSSQYSYSCLFFFLVLERRDSNEAKKKKRKSGKHFGRGYFCSSFSFSWWACEPMWWLFNKPFFGTLLHSLLGVFSMASMLLKRRKTWIEQAAEVRVHGGCEDKERSGRPLQ